MTRELLELTRTETIPLLGGVLLKVNHEGAGEREKAEFERDFNEILDLAEMAMGMKEEFLKHLRREIECISGVLSRHEQHGTLTRRVAARRTGELMGMIKAGYHLGLINSGDYEAFVGIAETIEEEAFLVTQEIEKRKMTKEQEVFL